MSNKISAKRKPDEQGDINDMKFSHLTSLTSRAIMASAGPPPPPPPPSSFGSLKPQAPSTPPPSPTPPPVPRSPSPLETADKAVQSSPLSPDFSLRRTQFARTVHTFFNQPQSSRSNVDENTADESVQTAALVHAEDSEVMAHSLAVPSALAAPCTRSKPPRRTPSSSYERREDNRPNGQISRETNSCSAGGDAVSVSISSAGSSSPRYGFENYHDRISRRQNSLSDDRSHKESCMESCVYYSVRCCECIVL